MASLVNRLTKTKPPPGIFASLKAAHAPKLAPQSANPKLVSSETLTLSDIKFEPSSRSSQIVFPSFPIGYCLNPRVSLPLLGPTEPEESESEDSRTVWADSTKQKRKKKMNKHKVQKRRKLLRRKSRS